MIFDAARRMFYLMKQARTPAELHSCPHCNASIQRLYIISGGVIKMGVASKVKMMIGCRDCHRSHSYKGNTVKAHWLALQLAQHPVRKYSTGRYSVA